jgi:hypothetical protein
MALSPGAFTEGQIQVTSFVFSLCLILDPSAASFATKLVGEKDHQLPSGKEGQV